MSNNRRTYIIKDSTMAAVISNPDLAGDFCRELFEFCMFGVKPVRFGSIREDMSPRERALALCMQDAIDYNMADADAYAAKSSRRSDAARAAANARWGRQSEPEPKQETEQEPEPEPEPEPKKRTARKTKKRTEKNDAGLTPEEIAIRDKNAAGRKIYFEAWSAYDPDDRSETSRRLIRADSACRNGLMERIADIGRDDMLEAVRRYISETDPKYRKSAMRFFADRIFENYIGNNYKPHSSGHDNGDVEFDLQEQYRRQQQVQSRNDSVDCSNASDEQLEEMFNGF